VNPLGRYIRETLVNLSRNALMSVASITIIAASLVLLGALIVFVSNLDLLIDTQTAKAEVTAFFKPGTDTGKVLERVREIRRYPEVAQATYVPKEKIVKTVIGRNNPHAEELVKDIKFPEGVEVKTRQPEQGKAVAERIGQMAEVDHVNYAAAVVSRLLVVKRAVNLGGLSAVLLFALAALLTVSNTIHLTITAREAEIGIMQLVGATAWYIKIPFLLEGMTHGLVGALLAVAALSLGYAHVHHYFQSNLSFVETVPPGVITPTVVAVLVGAGVAYGVLGSYLSVRRLLHVA